eukprot:CAMPEP_0196815686 /NCGR_PEP_ID=MMETSP1362-20130617/51248_1 /TAXON_ID=163516 /ORGANISM="Leptocylindrus danicus, Strain CCMP1856" /LENGTH=506 /DNA_ID=CAMNT_0042192735 /DNA_START=12 /DNA_END=1532 /DNA_ORIENTATION=-
MTQHFAGEAFLDHIPPNYDASRKELIIRIFSTILLLVCLIPYVTTSVLKSRAFQRWKESLGASTKKSADAKSKEQSSIKSKKSKNKNQNGSAIKVVGVKNELTEEEKEAKLREDFEEVYEPHWSTMLIMPLLNLFCLCCVIGLLINSPNNIYAARAIFQAPMLSSAECEEVIAMAHRAAERNVKAAKNAGDDSDLTEEKRKLLMDPPMGWKKDRHTRYPTTDLNVVIDPFLKEDRMYLEEKLNARLAPMIERVYGIVPGAIRANDIFIVRYDHDKQPNLISHTDGSDVSFNILLNDAFEGGGTQFLHRPSGQTFSVYPEKGQGLVHTALLQHEGLAVTKGTRYILVGFLHIDYVDPFTGEPTGLSKFASWFSLPWLQVRMKDGYLAAHKRLKKQTRGNLNTDYLGAVAENKKWTDHKYYRILLRDIHDVASSFCDFLSPHFMASLIHRDNATAYLNALDLGYERSKETRDKSPVWFKGQQIEVDVDGSITGGWKDRKHDSSKFENL